MTDIESPLGPAATQTDSESTSVPPEDPAVRGAGPAWLPWLLGVVVWAVRFAFAAERRIVHVVPDEPGIQAMARFLSGDVRWNMFTTYTWQPGLAFLIAPLNWVTDDPVQRYRLGLAVVAAVAGVSAVALAKLTARLTGMGPVASAVTALVICASPSSISATSYVWAESLVSLTFLLTLWYVLDVFEGGIDATVPVRTQVAAVSWASAGYLCHNRLLPLVAVVVLALAIRSVWRRRWKDAAVVIAVAALEWLAVSAVTRWIVSQVWDEVLQVNSSGSTLRRLTRPLDIADALVGQVWYQLAATAGLFGVGLVAIVVAAIGRGPLARSSRSVLLLTLPMIAVSATFVAGRERGDNYMYGRYNDAVVWPIVAVGIAWLIGRPDWRAVVRAQWIIPSIAVATVGLGLYVDGAHGDYIRREGVERIMVPGLIAYSHGAFEIPILAIGLGATVVFGLLVLIAAWPGREAGLLLAVVASGLLVLGDIRARDGLAVLLNVGTKASDVRSVEADLEPGERLGIHLAGNGPDDPGVSRRRAHFYQFFLVDREFVEIDAPVAGDGIRFLFAPSDDGDLVDAGATIVWTDPVVPVSLWREPEALW